MDNDNWIIGAVITLVLLIFGACGVGVFVEWKTGRVYDTTVTICDKNIEYDVEDGTHSGVAVDAHGQAYTFTSPSFYDLLKTGTTYKLTVRVSALTSPAIKRAEEASATATTGVCPK